MIRRGVMTMIEVLRQEFDQEAQTTRRVLERVPGDRLGWKPHDKSMSLGQLALHVAMVPGAVSDVARQSPYQMQQFTYPSPASAAELMPAFEQSVARGRDFLRTLDDAALAKTWRGMMGDKEVMAVPVGTFIRSVMLNHWYHHRGQLAVYLRQVGALVPSIYGPSADENPFAARQASAAPA
jgi:uncharacterized damage-inducible protein DinB